MYNNIIIIMILSVDLHDRDLKLLFVESNKTHVQGNVAAYRLIFKL